jgi:F0F1-type ATP synthase assembly protein I
MLKKYFNNKEISRSLFLYISYSILGPLLVVGSIGYFIDRIFQTRFFLLGSVFVAYLVSNYLMYKKLKKVSKDIDSIKIEKNNDNHSDKNEEDDYDDLID